MDKRSVDMYEKLKLYSSPDLTVAEIAELVGRSISQTRNALNRFRFPYSHGLKGFANPRVQRKQRTVENQEIVEKIKSLSDGIRTSKEIALLVGSTAKYVQEIMLQYDLPRLRKGARIGKNNPAYRSGRIIDLDGYILVRAPENHPFAKKSKGKNYGTIFEHRLVMEKTLGRFLQPEEVVDHIDGLHLHNSPENLRLFANNQEHLRATISGQVPQWSEDGFQKMSIKPDLRPQFAVVSKYREKRRCGDVRLQQILLAWLQLDTNSPFLLGSRRWLEKAGISDFSRSSLQFHLQTLLQKWGEIL